MIALDLFAGTGAATAAFRKRGWYVLTIDSSPAVRPDVLADVRRLPVSGPIDFLWARRRTRGTAAGRRTVCEGSHRKTPCTGVKELRPRFWIIENVRGAIPFLGIPAMKIGPWCLWGYFPPLQVSSELQSFRKDTKRVHSAAARATVPDSLSLAVVDAVERYWNFPQLLDMRPTRKHRHVRAPYGEALAKLFCP